ncbi:MAG: dihydroneopterin aldolase [bacterium]
MDRMFIRDLDVQCIIGTRPEERATKQRVIINVELACDLQKAAQSDRLEDTVNYSALCRKLVEMSGQSRFFLVEKLAGEVARVCLEERMVSSVSVTVDKPGALDRARSAAVTVSRSREV